MDSSEQQQYHNNSATPSAPTRQHDFPPTMVADFTTEEATLTTPDGIDLYTKTWLPKQTPRARLVFVHGFSDHCNFYDPFFPSLARRGITVFSFDQRGWGRSVQNSKQRGLTGTTEQVLADMTSVLEHVLNNTTTNTNTNNNTEEEEAGKQQQKQQNDIPLFLAGHSMGGGQTLYYASTGPKEITSRIRGYLAEAPLIAIHPKSRPWKSTVVLGRLAGKVLPHWQMVQKLEGKYICRDEDVCKAWENDELCHDTGTLEGLAGMLDRSAALESGEIVLREGQGEGGKTRLWVGCGTADMVVSEQATRKWFTKCAKVEDKEYKVYENFYHKLHAEPLEDKRIFAEDFAKWILDRSGSLDTTAKPKL